MRFRAAFSVGILALCVLIFSGFWVSAQDETPEVAMPTPGLVPSSTPIPRPLPSNTLTQDRVTLEFYFTTLAQGNTGLLHVTGDGLQGARARFMNKLIEFFPEPDDGFYGFVAVSMDQSPRKYDLDIFTWFDDESRETINTQVEVTLGSFIKQDVTLAPDKAYLADPEIERNELARMESIFDNVTTTQLWDANGFQLPIPGGELTSPFGAFRTFNGTLETRHTGWDIRATLGQPIMASASGTVAYTGLMDIHGNFVAIDHGYGVYSTYSHFSQVHVTRGQSITQGQVLGTVGSTGRTSGPHFHWEIVVNGVYVDSIQFMQMWKPG